MKKIIIIATILSILLFALAIYNCIFGNIVEGIFNFVALGIVVSVVLKEVAFWWETDLELRQKFTFKCKYCGHQFIPSFWTWLFVPHIASRRYMKCEKCKKLSLMRRK